MKTDEIIVRVVFILILIVMIAGYQNGRQLNNKLIASRIVLCAEVVSVKPDKGGGLLAGIYNYEGKAYKKKYSCLKKTKREYESGRKKF